MVVSDFKAIKHDCILSKHEFFWVEGYAALAASVKPVDCLEETDFNVTSPEECIGSTCRFIWDTQKKTRQNVGRIQVLYPRGNKICEMTVVRVYSNTIPAIEDSFLFVLVH